MLLVNGQRVNIPSYQVRSEDVVAVHEKAATRPVSSTRCNWPGHGFPEWVQVDVSKLSGVFKRVPDRGDLPPDAQ